MTNHIGPIIYLLYIGLVAKLEVDNIVRMTSVTGLMEVPRY